MLHGWGVARTEKIARQSTHNSLFLLEDGPASSFVDREHSGSEKNRFSEDLGSISRSFGGKINSD